ncbi:hypothetical protein SAMN04488142_1429 [Halomonas sp. hl-4]|nr:hypothetical protein SAMN04488142_1429 [Halomonas sp. hl-4]
MVDEAQDNIIESKIAVRVWLFIALIVNVKYQESLNVRFWPKTVAVTTSPGDLSFDYNLQIHTQGLTSVVQSLAPRR